MCFTFDCHLQAEACGLSSDKSGFSCRMKVEGAHSQQVGLCTPLMLSEHLKSKHKLCKLCFLWCSDQRELERHQSAAHALCLLFKCLSRPNVSAATKLEGSALIQSGVTQVECLHGMASIQRHGLTDDAACLILLAICLSDCLLWHAEVSLVCRPCEHRIRVCSLLQHD